MPNWCSNEVTVYADRQEDLTKLLSMATRNVLDDEDEEERNSPFRMESILTTPAELLGNNADDGWYGWRIKNWGCKWEMSDVEVDDPCPNGDNRYYFELRYQTPWSPNIAFWKYVCNMGPFTVEMRYIEEGMGYIGETTITKDDVDDYCVNITPEMFESVGAVLDDNGEVDWEKSEVNEWELFPLRREKVK